MSGLNEAQQKAVRHKDGPLLILAGAGAGKTRVITERIAELIRGGTAPEKILAVTFTNKAAGELKTRVSKILAEDFSLSPFDTPRATPFTATFHGLSLHIIKTFHNDAGLPARFSIFDRADSQRTLKKIIADVGFDPKQLEPRRVLSVMGKHKGNAMDVSEFLEGHAASYIDEAIGEVWEAYQKALKKEKALDFDDILLTAFQLLKKPHVRGHFHDAWEFLHIDEYQDTNRVQYEIVRALAEKHNNLAVVGDADQNIYSWRGASLEHILNFEHDFPGAAVVTLTQNYRSTKNILQAANDAIAKNVKRKEKVLTTENVEGDPIKIAGLADEGEEARFVVSECGVLMRDGHKAEDIAVLYRANFQSRVLEEAFLASGIPYQVLGTRFFERKEVKDALAYLRLAENPDSATDLSRAIGAPARGIGKVTLAKVLSGKEGELSGAQQGKVRGFRTIIERIAEKTRTEKTSEAVRYALEVSGLWDLYAKGKGEDEERLENLRELVSVATKYDTLPPGEGVAKLLEEAALQSDQDELALRKEDRPGVKLMTVHAAKGLEFPVVFVTGLEEGLFPHERDDEAADDEEERRLFYVALTRAEKRAYLSYALSRRIFGTRSINAPSEFIGEIDQSLAEVVQAPNWHREEDEDTIEL